MLFTYPLIDSIKAYNPDIQIGYVCNRRTFSLLQAKKEIERLFVYEKDEHKNLSQKCKSAALRYVRDFYEDIRKEHYDAVFDLSLNFYFSLLCWALGVRERIGLNYKNRSLFLSKKVPLIGYEGRHVIEYYLDLLKERNIPATEKYPRLDIPGKDIEWARQFLAANGIHESRRLIGLVPGGGASWGAAAECKRWSKESYAKLADNLIENFSADIILLGDESETPLCAQVQALMHRKTYSACGRSTILQYAALARLCRLVIVNDGGPLHIAAAAGAKTVSIFGPVDETVYGPYSYQRHAVVTSDVFCRPCYRRFKKAACSHMKCLGDISVDRVIAAARNLF